MNAIFDMDDKSIDDIYLFSTIITEFQDFNQKGGILTQAQNFQVLFQTEIF